MREPTLSRDFKLEEPKANELKANEAKPREGIVVSTVMRLTTSDGRSFEEPQKAIEHEAFYQILKRLVKELGWPDNEDSASFALALARSYRRLLPLLADLEKQADALQAHMREFQRAL